MRLTLPAGRLHGENLATCTAGSITLIDTRHPAMLTTPEHSHELALFCFVRDGSFTETYGRRRRECRPCSVIFRPSGESHVDRFHAAGARCLTVEIGNVWVEHAREYSAILDESRDYCGGILAWLAARLYAELGLGQSASNLAVEGLTLELLAEVSRNTSIVTERQPSHWLTQAREFLNDRFAERLTTAEVADAVGVHPVHLARTFRRIYRCTMGDYLRKLRIEFACGRIVASDESLAHIAVSAGFFDQSHFTRTFKQSIGVTPSQYRAAFRRC